VTSRRGFLQTSAALLSASAAFSQTKKVIAYVGAYSSPQGPEGSRGRGSGIHMFEMNPASGVLTAKEVFESDINPVWLEVNSDRSRLYSANEVSNGSVSAFAVDRASGRLTLLNRVGSGGEGPTHLSIHPSGKWVLVANYAAGKVAVLPILQDGKLGEASDVQEDHGAPGPPRATSAPEGSFAISGHDHPHAHMVQADPSGRFVLAADLGLDCIVVWKFDAAEGKLSDPERAALPPGDGPRHFVFHPNGRRLYSLQEEASTLVTFDFDPSTGRLTARQTISTLPKSFRGTNFTSGIRISPDARFIYISNRLHDSIAWFPIAKDGTLRFGGEEWTRGDYPRSLTIDPSGNFLFSCNQRGDAVTSFRINRQTGALAFTGHYTPVGTPSILTFL
jgi:6-phosphogluconolactonase (cycloisomerase 2 family)